MFMTRSLYFSLLIILLLSTDNKAARILAVFPVPSISHQVVFRPLTQELARRGHELVIITPDPAFPTGQTPVNITEINVHDISYRGWKEKFVKDVHAKSKYDIMISGLTQMVDVFTNQINSTEIQALINNKKEKFDLLLVEACMRTALAFSHRFNVPVIQVSSLSGMHSNFEAVGAPTHPIIYPTFTRTRLQNLSFWETIDELYFEIMFRYKYWQFEEVENKIIKQYFGDDTPTVDKLQENVDMLFLNVHPIWDGNRPVPSNVVFMGGLHVKPPKTLPEDLKTYLDSSTNGVIYMSLGTNVDPTKLPASTIQMFLNVFSRLPFDILWKWNDDNLPGKPHNVRISKWLPQSDLLRHPNIKFFITQGGLQSTDEAIIAGVPLIGLPILGDQWYNVEKYIQLKIGLRLDIQTLTEKKFHEAINTIQDSSYRSNIGKLRTLLSDDLQKPLDRVVWWTEYVLRHKGASHLRGPKYGWMDYFMVDLLAVLVAITLFSIVILAVLWRLLYSWISHIVLPSSSIKWKTL